MSGEGAQRKVLVRQGDSYGHRESSVGASQLETHRQRDSTQGSQVPLAAPRTYFLGWVSLVSWKVLLALAPVEDHLSHIALPVEGLGFE